MRRPRRSSAVIRRLLDVLGVVKRYSREGIEADLIQTDWIMRCWGSSVGDGLPLTDAQIERIASVGELAPRTPMPELDDETATIADQIYCALPEPQQLLAFMWWKIPEGRLSPEMIAARMNLPPDEIFVHVNRLLTAIRTQLRAEGIDC